VRGLIGVAAYPADESAVNASSPLIEAEGRIELRHKGCDRDRAINFEGKGTRCTVASNSSFVKKSDMH